MKYSNYRKELMLLFFITTAMLHACKKDPGNYTYTEINEAIVTNLDTLFSVDKGKAPNIVPAISYSKDEIGDTVNYKYEWLKLRKQGFTSGKPQILDSSLVFDDKVSIDVGLYECAFRVTDKRTGVWKQFPFRLFVNSITYEGWYLLSEIAGQQSRLDMLSYDVIHKKYNFISDILTEAGSDLKLKGRPNFISYFSTLSNPIVGNSADPIAIATNSIGVLVEPDGLVYRPAYDFSIFTQTATNAAIGQGGLMECKNFVTFLRSNGDVYTYDYGRMYPINKMSGASKTFKASRYVSHNPGTPVNYTSILFNEQTSEFVWYPADGNQVCYPLSNGTLFSNKINKNLLYMKYVNYNGGENFAILKDKTGGKVYLARFTSGQQRSFKEITGTPLAQAENFEISDIYGYIFYSIGGKLFEYDFNLDLNKQMLDYGTRKISLLKFQYIPNTNDPEKKRYLDITRRLVVCTYDPADLNTSGAMDIYSIPPINAPLVKEESYSGMGKIVSIDYRDR